MKATLLSTAAALSLGLLFAVAANAQDGPPPAAPGTMRMVEVDGHTVRVQALGLDRRAAGEPVVVFEGGASSPLEVWTHVLPHIAESTAVVAYDRAGLGRSEWDGETPTPQHVAYRLRRVLELIGAEPPYLMVGHSWGGALIRYFAGLHPQEVTGLVYVDPGPIVTESLMESLAPFEAIGAGRDGFEAFWSSVAAIFEQMPDLLEAERAEFEVWGGLAVSEIAERALLPVPEVPVAVVLAGKYTPRFPPFVQLPFDPVAHFEADLRHRIAMLGEWALQSPRGLLVVTNGSHHGIMAPTEEPEIVVWAIQRVLASARSTR